MASTARIRSIHPEWALVSQFQIRSGIAFAEFTVGCSVKVHHIALVFEPIGIDERSILNVIRQRRQEVQASEALNAIDTREERDVVGLRSRAIHPAPSTSPSPDESQSKSSIISVMN